VSAIVKAAAVVKREPPGHGRPPAPASVLDIELTVHLPTNPQQVTIAPRHLSLFGGVVVEETVKPPNNTTAVVLIRPMGTIVREGSMAALFGVACPGAEGNIRVDMKFAAPPRDGDTVTIQRVDSY
jgi:hypothetical protein